MLRLILIINFCFIFFHAGFTQVVPQKGSLDMNSNPQGYFIQIKEDPIAAIGSKYIYDEWCRGNVLLLSKQKLENQLLRYNIEDNQLEIKIDNELKAIYAKNIDSFDWRDTTGVKKFVNCAKFALKEPLLGFFEQLTYGKNELFVKTNLEIVEANYVAALDAGNKTPRRAKKDVFYLKTEDKIIKLSNKKKEILKIFGIKTTEMEEFSKKNRLSFKSKNDLKRLIDYYDSLL